MTLTDNARCGDNDELLRMRLDYPLKAKIHLTLERIQEWYEGWDGQVYVAFSGGKDSTVLLSLVRSLYPDVVAVYADTGLEYPEIKDFVRQHENVVWVRPKMSYRQVVDRYGYAVPTKRVAQMIKDLRNPTDRNVGVRNTYITGITKAGNKSSWKLAKRWYPLMKAPFPVSDKCCDILKKNPSIDFEKETGLKPFFGFMVEDSSLRALSYKQHGCNAFDTGRPRSTPLSFWREADIWEYIRTYDIPYCSVYDQGADRTGCVWCLFGVHLEKGENRLQRLARTHPQLHKYALDKMGLREVCEYLTDECGVDVPHGGELDED